MKVDRVMGHEVGYQEVVSWTASDGIMGVAHRKDIPKRALVETIMAGGITWYGSLFK